MIRTPILIAVSAAGLLLAGCGGTMDHDDGRWFVTRHGEEVDYEMGDQILFPNDSAEIGPHAYDIIASVAEDARHRARSDIEVQGFTDTSGSHDYNMRLSQARAEHVADLLVRHGISARRIVARGYGETRLAVPTPNGVREPRNRRVIIRILAPR